MTERPTRPMGTSTLDASYWEDRAMTAEATNERLRAALQQAADDLYHNGLTLEAEEARRALEPKP